MKPCFVSPILKKIARKIGIEIQIEPKYGYVGQIVLPVRMTKKSFMKIIPIKTRIFNKKESLTNFLIKHLPRLKEGEVVVITSKIAALSQGRVVPNLPEAKKKWIKKESKKVFL